MASPLRQIALTAPGFLGLNSEQQAASSQPRFATVLDNAVFDEAGKIQARKGYSVLASGTPDSVARVFWWRKDRTTTHLLAVGLVGATATVWDMTQTTNPYDTFTSIGTLSTTDVQIVNVNGFVVFVSQGNSPRVWSGSGSIADIGAATGTTGNPTGGVAASAFGRLFITSSDGKTVYGSELQPNPSTGMDWDNWFIDTTGNAGATAKDGWTFGRDYITGLGAIGDILCLFGQESLLCFSDVNGTPALADSINGVGCVNQHTIANVGDDLVFLSNAGVRSLVRTLAKETPSLNDVSAYVRGELLNAITASNAFGIYSPLDGWYLLSDGEEAYCFDMRERLPGGVRRASKWTLAPEYATYDPEGNALYLGIGDGACHYTGYRDNASSYKMTLKTAWLDFGSPQIKISKKLVGVIYNGDGYQPKYYIAYDWKENAEQTFLSSSLPVLNRFEWGDTTTGNGWGEAEWGGFPEQVNEDHIHAAGSGRSVRFGIEFTVNQFSVGVHEIRLFTKLGKMDHV